MTRTRIPVTFGPGMDRATGAGARDARTLRFARNVIAREAGVELRYGLDTLGFPALAWGTDILAVETVEATLDVLMVVYDRETRELRVFRINPIGPTLQQVASWGTLNASAQLPPVVTMAEQDGLVYFAHAEPQLAYRLPTKRWAKGALDTDAGTLVTAQADLDGTGGAADLYFYGVCAYRTYMVGWGWGTEASGQQDRPEIVRLTRPDDPTVWPPESYFICGSASMRVEACVPLPGGLCVRTRSVGFTIFGTDPSTFGLELTDPTAGIVSPRAWAVVNGAGYVWAASGPRIITDPNAPSEDVAVALDLPSPMPADWPALGRARFSFCAYEPEQRVLYWAWPALDVADATTTPVYVQSLRSAAPRFTTAVLARRVACAGRYLDGKAAPPAGTAFASAMAMTTPDVYESAPPYLGYRTVTATWTPNNVVGPESLEVWMREPYRDSPANGWALASVLPAAGRVSHTQYLRDPLTAYDFAVRYRALGGAYTTGYSEATPDAWSAAGAAGAKASIVTGAQAPTIDSVTWARLTPTTHAFTVNVIANQRVPDSRCTFLVERETSPDVWVTAGESTGSVIVAPSTVVPVTVALTDAAVPTGTAVKFRARLRRLLPAEHHGPNSATVTQSAGVGGGSPDPIPVPTLLLACDASAPGTPRVEVWIARQDRPLQFEQVGVGEIAPVGLPDGYFSPTSLNAYVLGVTASMPTSVQVRARYGRTTGGVTDWGDWSDALTCPVSATTDPEPDPVTADFVPSRGAFDGEFPEYVTPSGLDDANRELVLFFNIGPTQITSVGPESQEEYTAVTAGLFAVHDGAIAFHRNTVTARRSVNLVTIG